MGPATGGRAAKLAGVLAGFSCVRGGLSTYVRKAGVNLGVTRGAGCWPVQGTDWARPHPAGPFMGHYCRRIVHAFLPCAWAVCGHIWLTATAKADSKRLDGCPLKYWRSDLGSAEGSPNYIRAQLRVNGARRTGGKGVVGFPSATWLPVVVVGLGGWIREGWGRRGGLIRGQSRHIVGSSLVAGDAWHGLTSTC